MQSLGSTRTVLLLLLRWTGEGSVIREEAGTPALLSFEIRRFSEWGRKVGWWRERNFFFFPLQNWILSLLFCHKSWVQFQASHLNQIFDTWLELLCSFLSLCSARGSQNWSCLFTIWLSWPECGADAARTFRPLLIACSHQFSQATTGAWSGQLVRDPFAWIIFSLFWARLVLEMS